MDGAYHQSQQSKTSHLALIPSSLNLDSYLFVVIRWLPGYTKFKAKLKADALLLEESLLTSMHQWYALPNACLLRGVFDLKDTAQWSAS